MPMIKKALAALFLTCVFASPTLAAGIPIFWGTPEKIAKVADFPDTNDFKMEDGSFVDAGVKYKVFELFWVPLYDYDHDWAGYLGTDDTYVGLSHEKLQELAKTANVTLPETPTIPFWDAWGGKLLLAGLLALFVLYVVFSKDDDEPAPDDSQQT